MTDPGTKVYSVSMMNVTERRAAALKLFSVLEPTMGNLVSRWADEFEHEPVGDYAKVVKPIIAKAGGNLIHAKGTKNGLAFTYVLEGATYRIKISTTGRYSYERIK